MTIKELLIEADAIQVGVTESDWQKVIPAGGQPAGCKRLYLGRLRPGGDR
ncbi:PTS system ascorbate-specific transporter [Klebsiella michiganensis]|uniref:PTS system ascorbate-specific transporter n=1 Tax=Klebsiella michiganensis TaxID=1134687 RepID=A0A7H4PEI5_9ENTR|nr:PTS system ascorbate-specific transporter [Klebsiella michiganensis]